MRKSLPASSLRWRAFSNSSRPRHGRWTVTILSDSAADPPWSHEKEWNDLVPANHACFDFRTLPRLF